jgi:cyanophycinase
MEQFFMLHSKLVFALLLILAGSANAASPEKQSPGATNPLGLPEKAVASGGSLIICGGGRTPVSVYDEFARLAGGKGAKIIIIPSAYRYASTAVVEHRYSGWSRYEPKMLEVLDARSREQADSTVFNKRLEEATGVWLSGGYQSRLCGLYAGTKAEATLRAIVERGGVVGGISAGAAAMSKVMIHSGRGENVVIDRGLGLLETAIVDQHFTQRNRLKRLLAAVEQNEGKVGIGIDEGTALVVAGNRLRVIGNHDATVVLPRANNEVLTLKLATSEQADLVSAADAPTDVTRFDLRKLTGK